MVKPFSPRRNFYQKQLLKTKGENPGYVVDPFSPHKNFYKSKVVNKERVKHILLAYYWYSHFDPIGQVPTLRMHKK